MQSVGGCVPFGSEGVVMPETRQEILAQIIRSVRVLYLLKRHREDLMKLFEARIMGEI